MVNKQALKNRHSPSSAATPVWVRRGAVERIGWGSGVAAVLGVCYNRHVFKIRLDIDAAGQRYRQTNQFLYLGGVIHESADFSFEIERWIRLI